MADDPDTRGSIVAWTQSLPEPSCRERVAAFLWRLLDGAMSVVTGEFLLSGRANGGGVIFARASILTLVLYSLAIGLASRLAPGATWRFSPAALRSIVSSTLPWLGAMFAAVYAALYTRFAAQWSYLADLYNQLVQATVQFPSNPSSDATRALNAWRAAFIEDAEDLHLALKPSYAAVILSFLTVSEVRETFIRFTAGGECRLQRLEARAKKALAQADRAQRKAAT